MMKFFLLQIFSWYNCLHGKLLNPNPLKKKRRIVKAGNYSSMKHVVEKLSTTAEERS